MPTSNGTADWVSRFHQVRNSVLLVRCLCSLQLRNPHEDSRLAARLLPRDRLIRTGPVDHADWNYRPILGRIIRTRIDVVVALLGEQSGTRLLEIGYGSGILLPELSRRFAEVVGIDIHPCGSEVARELRDFGVAARLVRATATAMPFRSESFDAVVCVSAIEFVEDVNAACREIHRILAPGGVLVCVTPTQSPILDLGLRLLTGASAHRDFEDRRRHVGPALLGHFALLERRAVRPALMFGLQAYTGFLLQRPRRSRVDAMRPSATDSAD